MARSLQSISRDVLRTLTVSRPLRRNAKTSSHTLSVHDDLMSWLPLHILCENCKRFARECHLLDRLHDISPSDLDYQIDEHTLCTNEQLTQSASSCHLCCLFINTGVLSHGSEDVVLRLENTSRGTCSISIGNCGVPLVIKSISVDNNYSRPTALNWQSLPLDCRWNTLAMETWLGQCVAGHSKCQAFQNAIITKSDRPTRVLDLSNGKVRLTCSPDQDTHIQYATLSHMWGTNPSHQIRLIQKRLRAYEKDVPVIEMSHIYTEAIRVTRALGLQYLWIDSLCIIQDSKEDWLREAPKMATIYGHAFVNLSYVFNPQDVPTDQREDRRQYTPCILRQPTETSVGLYVTRSEEHSWLTQDSWPLLSRAWVMQERLLCARTIYLGLKTLVWECCQVYSDELLGVQSPKQTTLKSDMIVAAKHPKTTTSWSAQIDLHENWRSTSYQNTLWQKICVRYQHMALTVESDRVIAFAGIASAMEKLHGLTYMAGMWKEFLQANLLWHTALAQIPDEWTVQRHPSTDVPSWSWLSVKAVERHLPPAYGAKCTRDRTHPIIIPHWLKYTDTNITDWVWASYISFQSRSLPVNTLPAQYHHDIKGLRIKLRVKTFCAYLDQGMSLDHTGQAGRYLESQYFPDETLPADSRSRTDVKIAIIGQTYGDWLTYAGLVLLPTYEGGMWTRTWRRIGMWKSRRYRVDQTSWPPSVDYHPLRLFESKLAMEEIVFS